MLKERLETYASILGISVEGGLRNYLGISQSHQTKIEPIQSKQRNKPCMQLILWRQQSQRISSGSDFSLLTNRPTWFNDFAYFLCPFSSNEVLEGSKANLLLPVTWLSTPNLSKST